MSRDALKSLAPNDFRRLLPPETAAEILGVTKPTLARWRCNGVGPVFVKLGAKVGYQEADLAAWVASNRRQTTARAA
jgi:hypothetical protein